MEKDIHHQIKRWLQKDEKAFEQVFHYYYPRLYRYAYRYLKKRILGGGTLHRGPGPGLGKKIGYYPRGNI